MFTLTGKVASRTRAGVGGLRVEIIDRNISKDVIVAKAVTDADGSYRATFAIADLAKRGKQAPDLQARVFAGKAFLGASDVRYNASEHETLNVALTEHADTALPSEYETLTSTVSLLFKGALKDLQETDAQPDVTYLANKTGWDARAVALAALADQFSVRARQQKANIDPAFFYALFRAGVPADAGVLSGIDAENAARIWTRAIAQGVIPAALEKAVPAASKQWHQLASQRALEAPALSGLSSLKEMLTVSLGADAARHKQFANLQLQYPDPEKFWPAVRDAFGEATESRLRLDGQLGYLTLNNAPLIGKLHQAIGPGGLINAAMLAERGYYRADNWQTLIGKDGLPPEVPGATDDDKRRRYAELLAAQVRLSFPTPVVAQMIKSGETPLTGTVKDRTHVFLIAQQGKFDIGMQPVERYVKRSNLPVDAEVVAAVTRIQRVYQITPSHDAMNALLNRDVDSARAVVSYDRDDFVRAFKDEVGGEAIAELTYAKAQQVHAAVLNIALSYLTARRAPGIGVHSPARILDPTPAPAADVIAYPTLEGLFGGMDYCACDHCRSILSPAAYLVDLLQFCDRATARDGNPQAVLLARRPDIQHLPLTCENTNTPVPYIDLVNETLEYFVTNGLTLAGFQGHNTDDSAAPEELLATPQFVSDAAYSELADASFPLQLPFQQPLENLRRYFDRFDAPLAGVMEALRRDDSLDRTEPRDFGWRDILLEELRLSRGAYRLLSDSTLTLAALYGDAAGTSDEAMRDALSGVKAFARRLGISYDEVMQMLGTRFINPHSALIPKLERLGVPFSTLKALKDGAITDAAFNALLPADLDPSQYGGNVASWVRADANYANIMSVITIANPSDEGDLCSASALELRYANPDTRANKLRPFEFQKLIRFIRLWKGLGWTIDQTDMAIAALSPGLKDAATPAQLAEGFRTLVPRLGIVHRLLATLALNLNKDLPSLLACFAPIDTRGTASLYNQMFLGHAVVRAPGDVFAGDGYGNVLGGAPARLAAHAGTLRAAFALTDDEFGAIVGALGFDASTPLNIENISAVFRRGWLARKLKLSVRELLILMQCTGVDPFAAPDPPHAPIVKLVNLVSDLRSASVKPVQALYLMWNQDISGTSAPGDGEILTFARMLRSDLGAIESEFALVDDPDGQIARARMALVYGNEAADVLFGLLSETLVSGVPYSHGQPALEPAILGAAPGRVGYDDFRKQLTFSGVLTTATRDALRAVAGVTATFQDAVDRLYSENQRIVGPFFSRYPELRPLYDAYVASTDPVEAKRSRLLASFLPALKRQRKRQRALEAMGAAAKADIGSVAALLDDVEVLHAARLITAPALDDLTAVETIGLATTDASGSRTWTGYVEPTENGFHNFHIEADAASTVSFTLAGNRIAMSRDGAEWSNDAPLDLRAGTLYGVTVTAAPATDTLQIRWETAGRGREIIPPRYLYSAVITDHLRATYIRFLKLVSLQAALTLTAAELAHIGSDSDYQIAGQSWPNSLPVAGSADVPTSGGLSKALDALLTFARIKRDVSAGDERLLTAVQDPVAATARPDGLLFAVTRWDAGSVDALLARFGKVAADLAHLDTLSRVHAAFAQLSTLHITAPALLEVTTNDPTADTVRTLQAALRARYDERDWLPVLKPINDEMRSLRRDALVAYVLHLMNQHDDTRHIDTADKLFEFFLMDVQMEPCMQTSRVRHALSSVQLFIERCLMNLEARVAPSSINAAQWEWMKRYRVWEANRKVFLYPENWLEPELRDDQSPFFKEAMGELLQSDITDERAAMALGNYLSKLDEVAKLEPCGLYCQEGEPGTNDDIVHVVARTAGAHRKYFYRRREPSGWTPWEQIRLEIEDNPVIPVVWKNRLFLFWLKILKQASGTTAAPFPDGKPLAEVESSDLTTAPPTIAVNAVVCWSEYYNGKWQAARTSDFERPANLGIFNASGTGAFDRSAAVLSVYQEGNTLTVTIEVQGRSAAFKLYNAHSLPAAGATSLPTSLANSSQIAFLISDHTFGIDYRRHSHVTTRLLLENEIDDRALKPCHYDLQSGWEAPFFYEDARHVFYVTTSARSMPILDWDGFAIGERGRGEFERLPPLTITTDPGHAISDDAYIPMGIATTETVRFGEKDLGPAGAIITWPPPRF